VAAREVPEDLVVLVDLEEWLLLDLVDQVDRLGPLDLAGLVVLEVLQLPLLQLLLPKLVQEEVQIIQPSGRSTIEVSERLKRQRQ